MPRSTSITIRVSPNVERELEIIDGIERGIADAKAGRVIPHDQAVAEMLKVIADAKRWKAAQE